MPGVFDFLLGLDRGTIPLGWQAQNAGFGGGLLASDPVAPGNAQRRMPVLDAFRGLLAGPDTSGAPTRNRPVLDWAGNNKAGLYTMSSALLSQPTFAGGLSAGFGAMPQAAQFDQQRTERRQQQKAVGDFFSDPANAKAITPGQLKLLQQYPQLAEKYLVNMLTPTGNGGTDDIKEFEYAKKNGYTGSFTDFMNVKRTGADNTDTWRPATPEELKARNLPEDTPAQFNTKTGQLAPIPGVSTLAANNQKADDAKIIAGAIISGNQPPDLTRLYGASVSVRAELEKHGYDLTRAQQDWQITQRQLQTMSNPQQTRIRQNIGFAHESLDKIEELTKQWKAGQWPALNKVVLETAKQGGLGDKAASISTQLEAQISDLVADLAGIYMGGNSPTDHALELAETQLKSSWSEPVLLDMVKLARTNLRYRENSLRLGTVGFPNSQYNPFAEPAAPPAGGSSAADDLRQKYGLQ